MKIFTDSDLQSLDIPLSAKALGDFLKRTIHGDTEAPPRTVIPLNSETLVITAGSDARHFGLRTYSFRQGLQRDRQDQIVACWDRETHNLKALALGQLLGAWRTGILGGLAYQELAGQNTETCGIIGSGLQACTQARAIAALAKPKKFLVFSRGKKSRSDFARKLQDDTNVPTVALDNVEKLVRQSDALVVATNSPTPVLELSWLGRCQHITTVGPKTRKSHEVPAGIATWADLIVSDSPQQIEEQGENHFLADAISFQEIRRLGSDCKGGTNLRTLYLSAGLAGTEVALLAALAL